MIYDISYIMWLKKKTCKIGVYKKLYVYHYLKK